ncbi:lactococcin 972 family bacteriocin [Streptomyces sp. NPDC007157]|uniref:lactococcin 972 family bacteriocin n=1 Tax=Streptomyces sp. NPDC007157 TaxID=3154681 RepID=UPI00340F1A94
MIWVTRIFGCSRSYLSFKICPGYDHGANTAWSNYKHPDNQHASSVKTGGTVFGSGCTAKGKWSLASAGLNGSVSYYYNPNC